MNLYKFNFDLAGSANKINTITIPTDSKYSMGLKFFKGNEELILGDDVKITIQDDKYIYTPTEIFNNYAVFAGSTGSSCRESKTYQVNFHKDGKDPIWVKDQVSVAPSTTRSTTYITIQNILDAGITDFEDFDYYKFRWLAYCGQGSEKNHDLNEYKQLSDGVSTKYIVTDVYKTTFPTGSMYFGANDKRIYLFKINDKIGFIPLATAQTKAGQQPSESDFLTGSIMGWFGTMPGSAYARASLASVQLVKDEYIHNYISYGDQIPETNQSFAGVNVKTNDSKVSNWAITDSQMKIVYTDEWPELSATADDRVIYFVVDKPTPPQPVPPKPVPPTPGDDEYGMYMEDVPEDKTFDPTNVDDCLTFGDSGTTFKYTRNGVDYNLFAAINSTGAEATEDAAKTDQIVLNLIPEDSKVVAEFVSVKDNMLSWSRFEKVFDSDEAAEEYVDNYFVERFGEEVDQPNTSNPIPADFDTWEINDEQTMSIPITTETDDYVYIDDEEGSIKFIKRIPTFPQWVSADPS